ncbi:adhesion G-protein coupled receptor G2-like isoform X2 [Megalobrama amblycephala]|nr:adhesion G-protein coupled receptor G2-like isoform X2 [Megalobrama amblycephala]
MSRQKQNLLWLMIVCCASHQISCSKIILVGDNLTDTCFGDSCNKDINLTCPSGCHTKIENVCTMNVKINTSSLGHCETRGNKHSFNIANYGGKYEVRMNETTEDMELCFLPNESKCQLSKVPVDTLICNTTASACTLNANPNTGCLKLPSVDPNKTCEKASYDSDLCSRKEGSKYVLHLNGSEWMCVSCDDERSTTVRPTSQTTTKNPTTRFTPMSQTTTKNPTTSFTAPKITYNPTISSKPSVTIQLPTTILQTSEIIYNLTTDDLIDTDGFINPSKASDAMNNLESIMEENNTSNAQIIMGDVIGLLHIQDENTETRDMCYSSDPNRIDFVDCQSDWKTDIPWSVKIPSEAFNKSRLEHKGRASLGVLRFKNMGKDETKNYTVLNNEVYGITMCTNISNLANNIEMFFTQNDLVGEASCRSWDGKGNLTWTTSGCETVKVDNNTIKCSCSHLTFFAVLMSLPDRNITAPYVKSLSFITSIGCGISMFFLSVALFMHFLLRKAKSNQATKILMNMFVALFLLDLSFLSNESVANTEVKAACVFIALLMHYSMLTTFTWFFIQALHMYLWLIRQNVTITNYMRKITVFGWTFAAPIVITVVSFGGYKAVIINTTSGNNTQMCWTTDPLIHYIVNIGYYALVFIFTAGIFIMIVTRIVQARHIRAPDGKRKTFRKQLMMVLSLFLLFGLTWAVAFFSYGVMLIPSYYIFTVLNSFQGFFLFLYYYNIHNDVGGNFSDDPEGSGSTTTIVQSRNNAVENIYNKHN